MTIPIAAGAVQDPRSRRLLLSGGVLLILLGASVITGWVTGQDRLVRVLEGATPMPFNTALAFIVAGVALLAIRRGRSRLALAASVTVAGFGLLSLLQHTAELLPQLDTFLFTPTGPLTDSAGTRASPNLALTMFLAGSGLSAVSLRWYPMARFGAAQLGAAVATIALVDVVAFLSVMNGHGLIGVVPQMAIHSATGIALLGTVLTVTAWRASGDQGERRQNRVPLIIGLLVTMAAIMLAQVLTANDRERVREDVQVAAQGFTDRIGRDLQQRIAAMEVLARIWPGLRADASGEAARAILDFLPGAQALGWIDPRGSRRRVGTAGDRAAAAATGPWPEAELLARSRLGSVARLELLPATGEPILGVITPVGKEGRISGYLWLTTEAEPWLESALREVYPLYDVTVAAGQQPLYQRLTPGSRSTHVWAQSAAVPIGSLLWNVRVWPRVDTLATVRSALPIVVLTAGTLLGVLLGLSASLLRAAAIRAGQLTAAHEQLGAEMSERVAAQEALQRSEEQLRQAQKMEAVGRLSGGIAHDFNNILTDVRGNTRTLLAQGGFSGLARDALELIDRAAGRGSLLTARLLAFSQRQLLQPEPFPLGELVAGLHEELGLLLGPSVRLVIERRPGPDAVFADRRWLGQVVLDLAFNAREAMPLGGALWIRTMPASDELRSSLGVTQPGGDAVLLEIEDSGRGLDESARGRLFEPFFSAKKFDQGSGLALASAYGIVRQSGGEIAVRSVAGRGTRIGILLPAASMLVHPTVTMDLKGAVVVIAENEPEILKFSRRILEGAGCTVLAGESAEKALAEVEASGIPPDLLVSDIVMPGMSGVELAGQLRERVPGIGVMFVSAYTSDSMKDHGIAALDAYLLQKPFTAEVLLDRVRQALLQRQRGRPEA